MMCSQNAYLFLHDIVPKAERMDLHNSEAFHLEYVSLRQIPLMYENFILHKSSFMSISEFSVRKNIMHFLACSGHATNLSMYSKFNSA